MRRTVLLTNSVRLVGDKSSYHSLTPDGSPSNVQSRKAGTPKMIESSLPNPAFGHAV